MEHVEIAHHTGVMPVVICTRSDVKRTQSKNLQISLAFLLRFDALGYGRLLCKNFLTSFLQKFLCTYWA